MYFKLRAEHISRTQAFDAMERWEAAGIDAPRVWMDEVFDGFVHAVLVCSKEQAIQAQTVLWDMNNGAECILYPLTEEEADPYL